MILPEKVLLLLLVMLFESFAFLQLTNHIHSPGAYATYVDECQPQVSFYRMPERASADAR